MSKQINGFSKLSKQEKIDWISKTHFSDSQKAAHQLSSYWNSSPEVQTRHDEFIENTLTNFYMPLGVAPNFLINRCALHTTYGHRRELRGGCSWKCCQILV